MLAAGRKLLSVCMIYDIYMILFLYTFRALNLELETVA